MGVKLKRFHVDIFYPDWFDRSMEVFIDKLRGKQLVCSYHATKKYERLSREYQRVVRDLLATTRLETTDIRYIFEFYANDKNEIKKVCYRFPMNGDLQSDVIFVISSTGKLVTIFLNKNFDPHLSLDKSLYEQGEVNASK